MKGSMPTPGAVAAYQSRVWHTAVVKAITQAEALVVAESTRLGTVDGVIVLVDKTFFPNEWVGRFFTEQLTEAGWEVGKTAEGYEVSYQEQKEETEIKKGVDMSLLQTRIEQMKTAGSGL